MKKQRFKTLAKINKALMPGFGKKDLTKLSKIEKGMVAYRYWVTTNSMD